MASALVSPCSSVMPSNRCPSSHRSVAMATASECSPVLFTRGSQNVRITCTISYCGPGTSGVTILSEGCITRLAIPTLPGTRTFQAASASSCMDSISIFR